MDVETSGVVMIGTCDGRSARCTARSEPKAITAVWTLPGRKQINVCHDCLDEQVKTGSWKITGSRVPASPR